MNLSEDTIVVLKNFSAINQSLQFKPGSTLRTISPLGTIFVEAKISETIPQEFSLFDLNKLLAKISLYKDAKISFSQDRVHITSNNKSDYIKFCSPKVIARPPEKNIVLGDVDYSFTISQEDLEWMRKSAGISGSPNLVFESDGSDIYFVATDIKDDSSDQSRIKIGAANQKGTFRAVMKIENFKLLDGSYDVAIAKKGLAQFKHKNIPITYYIAIEAANSTFGEQS